MARTAEHRAPATTGAAAGPSVGAGAGGRPLRRRRRVETDAAVATGARARHVLVRLAQEARDLQQQLTRGHLQRVRAVGTAAVHRR